MACPHHDVFAVFGGGADAVMTSAGVDPLQVRDPSVQWQKTQHVRKAKWEDLTFPSDHKLYDAEGSQVQQVTHQQMWEEYSICYQVQCSKCPGEASCSHSSHCDESV